MKSSNYNFKFDFDESNKSLMYNSFTNSMALIDNDKYDLFYSFCKGENKIEDTDLINNLLRGGFLVDDEFDELKDIKLRLFKGRFHSSSLGLTIAPTSDCNFRCIYCYEKDVIKELHMTENIQKKIIQFVMNYVGTINNLSVTWYGGEPLLGIDAIKTLSDQFLTICEENNISYSAGIITNGYMLNRKNVELLSDLKVSFYQITVDGNRNTHNERRPLINGEGTFDKIINNMVECYDILPHVSLRINVDKSNISAGDEIVKLLTKKNLIEKVKPYLGKVTSDDDKSDICKQCYSTNEFAVEDLRFSQNNSNNITWMSKYPDLKSNYCGADMINSFVINSDGSLYKCWNDIGQENKSIGNVCDEFVIPKTSLLHNYLLYDPTEEKCKTCKLLPICMGGCPQSSLENKENCSVFKSAMNEYLAFTAKKIINERDKNQGEN